MLSFLSGEPELPLFFGEIERDFRSLSSDRERERDDRERSRESRLFDLERERGERERESRGDLERDFDFEWDCTSRLLWKSRKIKAYDK